jgi:molybdate transport system ATP-binding protein
MIQARIRKSYAGFSLDVEFTAAAGITVLFGASGAGKTLTLDCLAGFAKPDEGRILLDDVLLYDGAARVWLPPQRRQCGYVFQNYALFPHMTLRENLAFAAERLPRLERHRRINEMIDRFQLGDAAERKPGQCSGGQRQRCSIARALVSSPKVLLLDEPSRGLDALLRNELYDIVRQVRANFGIPVLLVTHDLEECFELGDETIILREGRIVQKAPPREVAERPANLDVARLLGMHSILEAEILQLDPQRNTSLLRLGEHRIAGEYYPGHLKGDRVWICVPNACVRAAPLHGSLRENQIAARLSRSHPRPGGSLLEFENGLFAFTSELPQNGEWAVEFPPSAIHVLPR